MNTYSVTDEVVTAHYLDASSVARVVNSLLYPGHPYAAVVNDVAAAMLNGDVEAANSATSTLGIYVEEDTDY